MKLNKIFISGLAMLALTSCNDYLDVDAPSKFTPEKIYTSAKDVNMALNGVYAELLASNTFGQGYTYNLVLNSDVDFVSNSSDAAQTNTPKRYDMTSASGTANSVWNATYSGIETANAFIHYLENSSIYDESNEDYASLQQYMGEAKVIRAMFYYELMCYWGDVPFTMEPTTTSDNFSPAITSRDVIAKEIMNDLIAVAPNMKRASQLSEGIERISQEACWALIARIGLQAAGYSLRHNADDATSYGYMGKPSATEETWFLTTAREYAKKVIDSGTHSLNTPYQEVFLNECNLKVVNNDDPIFELPFSVESSGYIGYRQGPKFESNGGSTNYQWGECGGNQQVEAFYRYSFKPGDMRRDAVTGWWYYTYDGCPKINNGYSMYNNKWSKMFNTTSAFTKISTGNTGINYPYLRYADVLLMYAEADVKLTGDVNAEAVDAVQQVRNRAYLGSTVAAPQVVAADADAFLDEILQERKWEFAGENMRWKDLVRNNKLSEVLYHTFLRYYAVASENGGMSDATINDMVVEYDGVDYFGGTLGETFTQEEVDAAIPGDAAWGRKAGDAKQGLLPWRMYYCWIENPKSNNYFANQELPVLYLVNPYFSWSQITNTIKTPEKFFKYIKNTYPKSIVATYTPIPDPSTATATLKDDIPYAEFYSWFYDADGYAKNQVLYSLYGFVHGGQIEKANFYFMRNGVEQQFDITVPQTDLPVVRYLLPIPREAITRSEGVYKNYYGYDN
ncbi:MAG: RagB/SusD family nutrient uptake outer membrane protein [Prevotella sp.]|nr:RagB/SusD family nutrient uptake outer membrane protein [Prevotella sp.]